MDDVRAVMDAVGAERAAWSASARAGRCARCSPPPTRTAARRWSLGAYARRNWAPDYPIGRRAEQDGWLRPTAEQWGRFATERFLCRARAVDRVRRGGDPVVHVLSRARRLARGVAAITDMNEEIDVRHALSAVRVPTLVVYRAQEYLREASATWARGCRARRWSRSRAPTTCRGRATRSAVLDAIEQFLGGLRRRGRRAEPDPHHRARGEPPGVRAHGARSALARFRGQPLDAPPGRCARASTARPAPSAARPRSPARSRRCARACTRASANCATAA